MSKKLLTPIFMMLFAAGFVLVSSCGNTKLETKRVAIMHTATVKQYCDVTYESDTGQVSSACFCELICNGTGVKTPINCNCRESGGQIICDQCDPCTTVTCPIPEPQVETTPEAGPEEAATESQVELQPEPQPEPTPEPVMEEPAQEQVQESVAETVVDGGETVQEMAQEPVVEAVVDGGSETQPESEPVVETASEGSVETTPEEPATEPAPEPQPEFTCTLSFTNLVDSTGATILVPNDFIAYTYSEGENQVVAHDPCNKRVFWRAREPWSFNADFVNVSDVFTEFGTKAMTIPVMCPTNFKTIVNGSDTYYYVDVPNGYELMAYRNTKAVCGSGNNYMWYWEMGQTAKIRINIYVRPSGNWMELVQ